MQKRTDVRLKQNNLILFLNIFSARKKQALSKRPDKQVFQLFSPGFSLDLVMPKHTELKGSKQNKIEILDPNNQQEYY